MSNLSDIGFPTPDETAINEMILHVLELAKPIKAPQGFYLVYSDPSGAEIFLQGNFDQELVGFNPHFAGTSRRNVTLVGNIERDSSDLDGGFRAVVDGSDVEFVFDVPDFRLVPEGGFPRAAEVQLTAFGSNDFKIGDESAEFSFVPAPIVDPEIPPRPIATISGELVGFEKRKNELSGEEFYWLKVTTVGGDVDVVADPKWIRSEPSKGNTVSGTFWLSGRTI
ncbi:MAG: hypothetical protein IPJ30_21280 [Acidobacteria bacterium]|nr:hypothetical protein [Acidobacteriota bacterium]